MKYVRHHPCIIYFVNNIAAFQFSSLEFYAQILNGEFLESKPFGSGGNSQPKAAEVPSNAPSTALAQSFHRDYVTYANRHRCAIHDEHIQSDGDDAKNPDGSRKGSLKVKCLPHNGNGTMDIITSWKDAFAVLVPHINATKSNEAGNCMMMLFYTKTCIHSAMVAPHYNALARHFPRLKIAAIDAFDFQALNTELGIVGLPTIMFYLQGRALVKYNSTEITLASLAAFVNKHSGIEPISSVLHYISEDFKGPLSNKVEQRTDYWLYVAWIFIIICGCFYFSKSTLYGQIVEMVQRNWRESEARHG